MSTAKQKAPSLSQLNREAKARGDSRWISPVDCRKHPGFFERKTNNAAGCCVKCGWEANARYEATNPEKVRESKARYKAENPERDARYYAENTAKVKASNARYRAEYPERVREAAALRYRANPKKVKVRVARWARENPEKCKAYKHRRRARKAEAGGDLTPQMVKDTLNSWRSKGMCCYLCGHPFGNDESITIDHMVPIVRRGPDSLHNIAPAHLSCNSSKRAKTAAEWFGFQDETLAA